VIDLVIWDWGDGIRETQNTLPVTHVYRAAGEYTIGVEVIQSEVGDPMDRLTDSASFIVKVPQTPATYTAAPSASPSPVGQPIPIVADRTADIDPGMTPYSGLTAPPTTSEPQSIAPAPRSSALSASGRSAATASVPITAIAAQPATYTSAVATTAATAADSGFLTQFGTGALLAAFGLAVGGIAYRTIISRRDTHPEIRSRVGPSNSRPSSIAPASEGDVTVQAPWEGYNPLASDSYDLLARLRRYDDRTRQTGPGRTMPLAERLDLSLVPTLPVPATLRALGPSVGCRVISVDHLGGAVCLRDQGTTAERLDVVKVEELLRLIEERYEQRWVPREPDPD
jgi:hypothetical protein